MKLPVALKHTPVVVTENYDQVDGRFAGNTDVKRLSLGLHRWKESGKANVSAKVWGDVGEEWSGQTGEIPLHRILDLSILICRSLAHFRDAYRYEHFYDPQEPTIDRIGLQGSSMTIAICTDNERINEEIKLFSQALSDEDEIIGERLRALSTILTDMGY
ncbi:DUF6530 family protein [Paenibacillus vulneris]|uniref:DUF6530 family protein n=1 Tax=Paenibacillus vulneris TaxID=1133364 RepID=A0ABW3URG2_9BACL|nr:DUF6530 family protein [Paenibacillus sp. 32352]